MRINNFRGKYAFLSNFYTADIVFDGITYKNNEAAFQAQKCVNDADRKAFSTLNPSEAKKKGRHVVLRPDWEDVKFNLMRKIVKAKFEQNPDLARKLDDTGDAQLEEGNTWGDRIWGTVNGAGQNNLGKILMQVRKELRQKRTNTINYNNIIKNAVNSMIVNAPAEEMLEGARITSAAISDAGVILHLDNGVKFMFTCSSGQYYIEKEN